MLVIRPSVLSDSSPGKRKKKMTVLILNRSEAKSLWLPKRRGEGDFLFKDIRPP